MPYLSTLAFLCCRYVFTVHIGQPWREEFIDREFNPLEHLARIVARAHELLIRHAVVVNRYHHLHRTLKLDDREQTQGNQHYFMRLNAFEAAVDAVTDGARDTAGRLAATGFRALTEIAREADRVNHLYLWLQTVSKTPQADQHFPGSLHIDMLNQRHERCAIKLSDIKIRQYI